MQIFITILAISIIAIGIFRGQPKQEAVSNTVLSTSVDESTIPSTPTIEPTDVPDSQLSLSPKNEPTKTVTTRSPKPKQDNTSLNEWMYPESVVITRDASNITLTSSDDPGQITSWYKNKIKELRLNATSTVQTNTNNSIHNVLAASGYGMSIHIEITKSPSESSVYVIVTNQ